MKRKEKLKTDFWVMSIISPAVAPVIQANIEIIGQLSRDTVYVFCQIILLLQFAIAPSLGVMKQSLH